MNKTLDVTVVNLNNVSFRKVNIKGRPVEIIQLELVDCEGVEYRHTLFLDGNKGQDAAIENAKACLEYYGWDGKELGSLTEAAGRVKHIKFPEDGVEVAYRVKEYRDKNAKLNEYNEVRWIHGLGGGGLAKEEIDSIEKKFSRLESKSSSDTPPSGSTGQAESEDDFI